MEKKDEGNPPMAVMASRDDNEDAKISMRTAETMLRLVPVALCVSALVVMLKNTQTNDYGSLSYSDLGAFRYLVNANGICAGYSLLSAVIVAMPRAWTVPQAWTFFLTRPGVNICDSGCRHSIDGGIIPGEQGRHIHRLERSDCASKVFGA